jgi:alkylhydroperoxidase/carboxymuconolactone decarboxylase family protein YurZ
MTMDAGAIPAKYKLLMVMIAAHPAGTRALADEARAAGASEAEVAEALRVADRYRGTRDRPRRGRAGLRACGALLCAALVVAAGLFVRSAPPSRADNCGDHSPVGDCTDPPRPPWIGAIEQRDPQFVDSYLGMRDRILRDGAIPAKYKLLTGMVTDAIAAHPDGVRLLADNARGAGASEAEVTEAVEVGYLFGGTAALVMGVNAFKG